MRKLIEYLEAYRSILIVLSLLSLHGFGTLLD